MVIVIVSKLCEGLNALGIFALGANINCVVNNTNCTYVTCCVYIVCVVLKL